MAIEVEKTSKIWPQKTSSAASKALTSLQNNIHKLTSSTSSKSKPELPADTISKILEDSKRFSCQTILVIKQWFIMVQSKLQNLI